MRQIERRTPSLSTVPGPNRTTTTLAPPGHDDCSPNTTLRNCDLVMLLVEFALLTMTAKSVSPPTAHRVSVNRIGIQTMLFMISVFIARYPQNANESCDCTVLLDPCPVWNKRP